MMANKFAAVPSLQIRFEIVKQSGEVLLKQLKASNTCIFQSKTAKEKFDIGMNG